MADPFVFKGQPTDWSDIIFRDHYVKHAQLNLMQLIPPLMIKRSFGNIQYDFNYVNFFVNVKIILLPTLLIMVYNYVVFYDLSFRYIVLKKCVITLCLWLK